MPYIGRDTDKLSNVEVLDNITFDGSSSYTLQKGGSNFTPSSANNILISIDGVVQAGNFTVSGSTIDFGTAVAGTSTCDFILHYGIGLITTPSDGTVTTAKLADSSVTTAKLNDASVSLAKLTATGTKDATTFLRGDNTFAEAGGGAWEKISTTTVTTNVASVDFNTLSTDYKDFKVVMSAVKNATHQQDLLMRVKRSGQASFDSGASDYHYNVYGYRETGGVTNDASTGASYIKITPVNCASESGVSGATNNFEIDVYNVHGTNNKKFIRSFMAWTEGTYGRSASAFGSAYRNNQEALIGLQFYFASGDIDEGFFTLYGRAI